MGCDIHLRVEVKRDGFWLPAEKVPEYEAFKQGRIFSEYELEDATKKGCAPEERYPSERFYNDRNYRLFAILAGVRNDWFIEPIAPLRGKPKDLSGEIIIENNAGFWLGDHSFSWLTLAELDAYDWDKKLVNQGILSYEQWKAWKESDSPQPESWSKGRSGPSMSLHVEADFRHYLSYGWDPPINSYTIATWTVTYREAVGEHWMNFMERLHKLGKPEDVRIVFGFDS